MAVNRLVVERTGTSSESSRTAGSPGMVLEYVNCAIKILSKIQLNMKDRMQQYTRPSHTEKETLSSKQSQCTYVSL